MTTYTKASNFIRRTKNKEHFFDKIREILEEDEANYPTDKQIKELQRKADFKYNFVLCADEQKELTEKQIQLATDKLEGAIINLECLNNASKEYDNNLDILINRLADVVNILNNEILNK